MQHPPSRSLRHAHAMPLNNVQHCLVIKILYTQMRHSTNSNFVLLTFDISLVFSSQPKTIDMHVGHFLGGERSHTVLGMQCN